MTSWHEYHQYELENGGMDDPDEADAARIRVGQFRCEVCGRGLIAEDLELNTGMCWKCHHE